MAIKIINLRWITKVDFKCDRTTPLGNPFLMQNENTREIVCDRYEKYFHSSVKGEYLPFSPRAIYLNEIIQAAKERDITLGCWCAPARCHCETIKSYIEDIIDG